MSHSWNWYAEGIILKIILNEDRVISKIKINKNDLRSAHIKGYKLMVEAIASSE